MQGWLDEALNQNGRDLAVVTGKNMKGIHFDCCISSPLIRARETAEIILRESENNIPIHTDARIMEMNVGSWERRKFRPGEEEVDADQIRLFFRDPFSFPGYPGGEKIEDVCRRTQVFLKELTARNDDKTYLIVTHGCALRAMLNFIYDNPEDFWHGHLPFNCCVNIVEAKDGETKLIADDKIYYPSELAIDRFR